MSQQLYVPRVWGGVLLITYTPAPQVIVQPGIATLSDGLHGAAAIQDVLVDQATASDREVGVATISDQA